MTIIYDVRFTDSSYADNNASLSGRMEAAIKGIEGTSYTVISPRSATQEELLLAHGKEYINKVASDVNLFNIASLASGGAIVAAELGLSGEPSFALIRPPGHHASRDNAWGHCVFNNVAIALLSLRTRSMIRSAFILDFDAHTGDGTREILAEWREAVTCNPWEATSWKYLSYIQKTLDALQHIDIIAVSAGFDSYIQDVGRKLSTDDFAHIGELVKNASIRLCGGKRFAVLEGGYYLRDLGANVASFCKGFS